MSGSLFLRHSVLLLLVDCEVFLTAVYNVVQFQFVNSFLSLFYIAFYLQDMQMLKDVSSLFFLTLSHWCLFSIPYLLLLSSRFPKAVVTDISSFSSVIYKNFFTHSVSL